MKVNSAKAWFYASRPKTLTGAMAPVIVGGAMAWFQNNKHKAREHGRKKHKRTLNFIQIIWFGNFWRLYAGGFCTS